MKRHWLVPGLVGTGLLLLIVGFSWDRIVPTSAYWGDEQAREYTAAQAEMHAIDEHTPGQEQKLALARDRFLKLHQQLEDARGTQTRGTFLLKLAGISLLVVGVVWHFAAGQSSD
jgi:hypothetical protein